MKKENGIPEAVFKIAEQFFTDIEDFISIDSELEKMELIGSIAKRMYDFIKSRTNFLEDQIEAANERLSWALGKISEAVNKGRK